MIKSDIINKICRKLNNLPEHTIASSVNCILEEISHNLAQNNRIEIRGFGSFCLHHHAPRDAHNPKTGEKVYTNAKYSPHFKTGKELRDRVNKAKGDYPIQED